MRQLPTVLACALLAAGALAQTPNVILVMADDVGAEAFGCYGGTSYRTPRLDQLAKEGVRFTHCYSQPLCTPSRVKIMTGQSNIRNYEQFSILPRDQKTFGHLLQEAGYRTCVVGKWQLLAARHYGKLAGKGMHPKDAGFHEYCLWQVDRLGSRYWDPLILENGKQRQDMQGKYGPDVFTDYACEFIRKNKQRPFFLYYPMALVHAPYKSIPGATRPGKRQKRFSDMVTYMDRLVGRIVDTLKECGIAKRTIVLFTTDNGTGKRIVSRLGNRKVKGGKGTPTDAGTHVPLIAWQGGQQPAGRECHDLVDFSDFVPTLLEVAGRKPPKGLHLDGRSFLPQLSGKPGQPRKWIFIYSNPRPGKTTPIRFARNHRFKLYGSGKLYDVVADPEESAPLPAESADPKVKAARVLLRAAIGSMPAEAARIRAR